MFQISRCCPYFGYVGQKKIPETAPKTAQDDKGPCSGEDLPSRRFVARAKSNIGPDGGGFDYQLLQTELKLHEGVVAAYVQWHGAIQGSARDLLGAVEVDDQKGDDGHEREDAKLFLLSILADGPLPVTRIKADATGAGYSWRTIERAKREEGIEARKLGLKDGWVWAVPS